MTGICSKCIKNDVCRFEDDGYINACIHYIPDGIERKYKVTMRYCTEVMARDEQEAERKAYCEVMDNDYEFKYEVEEVR